MECHPETMQRVSLDDAEIDYSERGQGEPILLVHAGVFGDWFLPVSASPTLDGPPFQVPAFIRRTEA